MANGHERREISWLHKELPALVSGGVISQQSADAIAAHYSAGPRGRNLAYVLLAIVGSALIAAGIVLLVAHNWDYLSRPVRSVIAFVPLIASQLLAGFALWRRDGSQAWRDAAAILNVAGIGTAISLVSQTYQIHGSIANFIFVWLLLSLPLIYLMRTTVGAVVYMVGSVVWLFYSNSWIRSVSPLPFWFLLILVVPYLILLYRRASSSRETASTFIVLAIAAAIGLAQTTGYTKSELGALAFAGFVTTVYLSGIQFFRGSTQDRLHPLALLGGLGVGVTCVVMSFVSYWTSVQAPVWPQKENGIVLVGIELAFAAAAIALAIASFLRAGARFSILAAALPFVVGIGWLLRPRSDLAALLLNFYTLGLGIELIMRGLRADSLARTNFGLLVVAALAMARFFDSDLSFLFRAIGFIIIGLGFLAVNFVLYRKRRTT